MLCDCERLEMGALFVLFWNDRNDFQGETILVIYLKVE